MKRLLLSMILAAFGLALATPTHAASPATSGPIQTLVDPGGGGGSITYWRNTGYPCVLSSGFVYGTLWQGFYDPWYIYPNGEWRCGYL